MKIEITKCENGFIIYTGYHQSTDDNVTCLEAPRTLIAKDFSDLIEKLAELTDEKRKEAV